ncbi:MAG: hypothetical protein WCP29_17370 [Acidobacteriota bacterium]
MQKKIKGQKGLSLVEVTIMLLVLMLLTSVLAPSMWDMIHDAQWVKVKEDCEAIGISLTRMWRDVGPCTKKSAVVGCTMTNRVDVLISTGVVAAGGSGAAAFNTNITTGDWNTALAANKDTMENQLVVNNPAYKTPYANYITDGAVPVGPLFGTGWRGAYLAPPIGPDPWGSAYYVNSGYHATATNAPDTDAEGSPNWWWEHDVFCITAGPNQTLETKFYGNTSFGTSRLNDDFTFIISGSGK